MGNTHQATIQTVSRISGYQKEFRSVSGEGPITIDQVADVKPIVPQELHK